LENTIAKNRGEHEKMKMANIIRIAWVTLTT
jgi:hypothetical protein